MLNVTVNYTKPTWSTDPVPTADTLLKIQELPEALRETAASRGFQVSPPRGDYSESGMSVVFEVA